MEFEGNEETDRRELVPHAAGAVRACPKCRSVYRTQTEFCGLDGSRLILSAEDPLLGRRIDRYELLDFIGSGGMGAVYRAKHVVLGRELAIKVLFGELAADKVVAGRFRREAMTVSKIQHPNIVSVIDFGATEDGLSFLVMEYARGSNLAELIAAEGPLSPERARRLMRDIAAGLEEAHRLGFVHRDLKPGNVVVEATRDGERAKILDFGLVGLLDAEDSDSRLTKSRTMLGTLLYMAPEQMRDARVDGRADLYALGVILYEMLAGMPPFVGEREQVMLAHLTAPAPPLPPSGGLEALAAALLEKNPEDRPASAGEVLARLDALGVLAHEARPSPPPSWPGLLAAHPLVAGSAAAVMLLGLGIGWVMSGPAAVVTPVAVAEAPAAGTERPTRGWREEAKETARIAAWQRGLSYTDATRLPGVPRALERLDLLGDDPTPGELARELANLEAAITVAEISDALLREKLEAVSVRLERARASLGEERAKVFDERYREAAAELRPELDRGRREGLARRLSLLERDLLVIDEMRVE